jgi:tetratricopeptide (TPR) repeat protein
VLRAITGRFPRYPEEYYQGRIKLATKAVDRTPTRLDLYDDIGVAYDRIHRSNHAIEWMNRKRAQMERAGVKDQDAWYRYYANIGTFMIHGWLREGAKKERLDEAVKARAMIAKAIEINPDAHFGRERVQLRVMDWLIKVKTGTPTSLGEYLTEQDGTDEDKMRKSIVGLAGLVVMGNAWESVDVFGALTEMLGHMVVGDGILGHMAHLRTQELEDQGKKAIVAGSDMVSVESTPEDPSTIEKQFWDLRANANHWHHHRTQFLRSNLRDGKQHPDTHENFWEWYKEVPEPELPGAPRKSNSTAILWGAAGLVGAGTATWLLRRRVHSR